MIQRIQSLFLFFAVVAAVVFVAMPRNWAVFAGSEGWVHGLVTGIVVLVLFMLVFSFLSYANRKKQLQWVNVAQWLTVVWMAVLYGIWFYFGNLSARIQGVDGTVPLVMALLPILVYIFIFLAKRAINKDEALIKSMDRLRD